MLVIVSGLLVWFVSSSELLRCLPKLSFSFNFALFPLIIGLIVVVFASLCRFEFFLLGFDVAMLQILDPAIRVVRPASRPSFVLFHKLIYFQILLNWLLGPTRDRFLDFWGVNLSNLDFMITTFRVLDLRFFLSEKTVD